MHCGGWHWLVAWVASTGFIVTLGNAFLEVQAIIEPSKRYVLEERLEDEQETQESGDPPDAGEKGRPTTG